MRFWNALTNSTSHGVLHIWNGDEFEHTPWRDVARDSLAMAAALRRRGVRPGTRVAAILTNTPDTVRGLLAVWLAGGAVASLPLPTRGQSTEEYGRQLTALAARLDPVLLLADDWIAPLLPAELSGHLPVCGWSSLRGTGAGAGAGTAAGIEPSPPGDDELAFIQYSSGSTSTPKGCALTTRSIEEQLRIILHLTGGRPGADTVASWLPLSHDMGMFGCLLYSWAYDFDFVLSTPERFGMAPRTWFRDMSEYEVTMTAGTSTAVYLAARAQGNGRLPRELRLRAAVIGAERVEWDTLAAATEKFRPFGLSDTAFQPAYGMAEATLAVTGKPWDQRPKALTVDGSALVEGEVRQVEPGHPLATRLVSNGVPLPGVRVTTDAPASSSPGVAEIRVSSPSLAEGYYADPRRTADRFENGRLRTGDLGFLRDGELYVMGRADDMLSVGGRKVYASEIESAVDSLKNVRKGCAAVIDAGGGSGSGNGASAPSPSRLVLMLEPQGNPRDFRPIADAAASLAMDKAGVALAECLFLPRGVLPKTPSGKIQRFRCRALLDSADSLQPLARVSLS
ncbi:AMP-binding protein [Streptomyces sp. 891-h]|uniref:AMP-binding protein n=1 Tax=Streptomyces sp. 891-h TaxID=2720714 RepID=UPI001FA9D231|nr:AMP-binding protein [Streptomyces sp. 891-h]UNZ19543.1 fatty acyl-AMP ligase [Streptomyces sp. 891-h]